MEVNSSSAGPMDVETDLLCCMVTEESGIPPELESDPTIGAAVRQAAGDLGGRFARIVTVANPGQKPPRVLLAGLGSKDKVGPDTIRHVSGAVAQKARELRVSRFAVMCPLGGVAEPDESAAQIVEGSVLSLYNFDAYKSEKSDPAPDLTVVCASDMSGPVRTAKAAADGVVFARSVANLPPNECPPAGMADFASKIAENGKIKCTILSGPDLSEGGFGGIIAVGQGSVNTPRLIILEYNGGEGRPVALVGKAVTFDTGGISIKPGEKMDEMKFDKCGGCTVLGIIKAAAELELPVNIVGLVPSVENMPGGESYRPGDIIKLYGGKTAEILNTDAEGRLILADALSYAESRFAPKAIIDFATLTGACIIALGCNVAGMVSNNDELAASVSESADRTAEGVWRLPLNDDYMDMIKSKVADIKNLGTGRAAGTIAAAAFLRSAINSTPWLHLDIAGTAWIQPPSKKKPYNPQGATGFGVRLVLDYLRRLG